MSIEEKVEELVGAVIAEKKLPVKLVDVEYVKERDWYLRIFIDKPGGVSLDDCQELSEIIGNELDKRDLIADSYLLEVSSPGLDRQLRKPRDFARERGKTVDVTFFKARPEGGKSLTGVLTDYDGETLRLNDGELSLPVKEIAAVRLHIDI